MPPQTVGSGALCIRVVHPSVRPSTHILRDAIPLYLVEGFQ